MRANIRIGCVKGACALESKTRFQSILKGVSVTHRLMHEPRGHDEMYGAILIAETELTQRDEADIGVLFCHNGKSAQSRRDA